MSLADALRELVWGIASGAGLIVRVLWDALR